MFPYIGLVKMVQLLLLHHAEVNFTDTEGNTPLHIACQDDMLEVAKLLVEHGADINRQNKEKQTPLDYVKPVNRNVLTRTYQRNIIPT